MSKQLSKTIIMRPPYYGLKCKEINNLIDMQLEEPEEYKYMPKYSIHPLNLPGSNENPDIIKEIEYYNWTAFKRNSFSLDCFIYESLQFKITHDKKGKYQTMIDTYWYDDLEDKNPYFKYNAEYEKFIHDMIRCLNIKKIPNYIFGALRRDIRSIRKKQINII